MLSIGKGELWNSIRQQKIDDMISTMRFRGHSGFELRHKGSLPFLHGLPFLSIGLTALPSIFLGLAVSHSILADFRCDAIGCFVQNRLFQLAFPDNDDKPPLGLQLTPHFLVSFLVTCHFRHPKLRISLGDSVMLTSLVSMPETTMDKDNSAVLGEDNVWGSRKLFNVYAVTKTSYP